MQLTPQQDQVLALISAGSTVSQAARSAGIHRNSIHNWLRSAPPFQLALAGARQTKALYWQDQAEELAADALLTIRTLMTDPKTPAAVRLKAALSILTLATTPPPDLQLASFPDDPPPTPAAEVSGKVHKTAQSADPAGARIDPELASFPEIPQSAPAAAISENVHKTAQPIRSAAVKIGRNDLCPCGSGRKFKRCCLPNAQSAAQAKAA